MPLATGTEWAGLCLIHHHRAAIRPSAGLWCLTKDLYSVVVALALALAVAVAIVSRPVDRPRERSAAMQPLRERMRYFILVVVDVRHNDVALERLDRIRFGISGRQIIPTQWSPPIPAPKTLVVLLEHREFEKES